jgi:hypothetical protein
MSALELAVAQEDGCRKIALAQVCAFLSPVWRTKGAKWCYGLFSSVTRI